MSDMLLSIKDNESYYDLHFDESGDIEKTDGLTTSIIMSLFTDRRADPDTVLISENRGGWIGQLYSDGYKPGSLLWLLMQRGFESASGEAAVVYAREALTWMLSDNIIKDISISYTLDSEKLNLEINAVTLDDVYNSYNYTVVEETINDNHHT